MIKLHIAVSAALVAVGASPGCGTTCEQILQDRDLYFARTARVDAPHASVVIPLALANRLVAARLATRESDRIPVPAFDLFGAELGVAFAVTGARLVPAGDGRIGVAVDVRVRDGETPLFAVEVEAHVRPEVDLARRVVAVMLRPGDVQRVTPRLDAEGRARVLAWLRDALPRALAAALPDSVLEPAAEVAVAWLGDVGFPLVRDHLLAGFEDAPIIEVALPEGLPLARVAVRSTDGPVPGLHFDLVSTLPIARRLPRALGDVVAGVVELRVAGGAAAELANLAMARGAAPSRFDEDGAPDPTGPFEARVGWTPGRRPLKLHVWRTTGRCVYGRVAGTPAARLSDDEVTIAVTDGVWEEIRGPALTEAFAWTKQLFGSSVRVSVDLARSTRLEVAGAPLDLRIGALQIGHDEVRVALRVDE